MKHWFSDLYASIDAMRLDEFTAGLAPDVKVVVGNNPAMNGRQAAKEGIGSFFSTIDGIRHHLLNVAESNGLTFLEANVEYLRKDGRTVTNSRGHRAGAKRRSGEIPSHLFRRWTGLRVSFAAVV